MARKRHSDEDILKLLREIELHLAAERARGNLDPDRSLIHSLAVGHDVGPAVRARDENRRYIFRLWRFFTLGLLYFRFRQIHRLVGKNVDRIYPCAIAPFDNMIIV